MQKTLAHIGYVVDNIPAKEYNSKDLKIFVSEHTWSCIVEELKDYKPYKDQVNDEKVKTFAFDGIDVICSPSVTGLNIFYGDSLEEALKQKK